MPPEIEDKAAELAETAQENANAVIEQAVESADEIKGDAAESVSVAAEAVENLTEQVTDMQKELEWKTATQNQLAELTAKISALESSHHQIPASLEAMKMELLEKLTLPPPPPRESEADLPEAVSETALSPESTAEPQEPPKSKRAWL